LATPDHVVDEDLFLFQNPFLPRQAKGEKQGSLIIIFSCWKTMLGTAVVTLPWAY
jgi:amino acid permease